ncbi:MAG TPA: DUF6644 family protein [Caulobacteraceae bacterium]|nr:DUF6644 family protein [Caulobacteraceae bacterium]
MEQAIAAFCDWLSATPISLTIQSVLWIIPVIQSIHIIAVTLIVGAVLMVDMKLLGVVGRDMPISGATRRFLPWVWVAVVVLLLTGSVLTVAEPRRELINNVFRLKMLLVLAACALTGGFQIIVSRNAEAWGDQPSNQWSARAVAIISLALWVGIIMCGRWIAYVEHG